MRHAIKTVLVTLALAGGSSAALADAADGEEIAAEYCAECHDISAGGARQTYPPSFASIAWFRADEHIHARILFPVLHSPMPAWANWLTGDEVKSLVAYIRSLEEE